MPALENASITLEELFMQKQTEIKSDTQIVDIDILIDPF